MGNCISYTLKKIDSKYAKALKVVNGKSNFDINLNNSDECPDCGCPYCFCICND